MATNVSNIVKKLHRFSNRSELHLFIEKVIEDKQGWLLKDYKLRLFNKGENADGSLIGLYEPSTIRHKKYKGQRSSFVTLRDTGDFYRGMYLEYEKGKLTVNSFDEKTGDIVEQYGKEIFELSEAEVTKFVKDYIQPEIDKAILNMLGENGTINIDLL